LKQVKLCVSQKFKAAGRQASLITSNGELQASLITSDGELQASLITSDGELQASLIFFLQKNSEIFLTKKIITILDDYEYWGKVKRKLAVLSVS